MSKARKWVSSPFYYLLLLFRGVGRGLSNVSYAILCFWAWMHAAAKIVYAVRSTGGMCSENWVELAHYLYFILFLLTCVNGYRLDCQQRNRQATFTVR